jgi:methoxymalonate biosynthesis protein
VTASAFLDTARSGAADWDDVGSLPVELIRGAGRAGLLAADLPHHYGGSGATTLELGELSADVGAVCSSLRALLTVQSMVAAAVLRWGSGAQRENWLPRLASGEAVAAFAATEPGAGTELTAVDTRIDPAGAELRITGRKVWVTFGEVADVVLVLGRLDGAPTAVLVETDRPGLRREPVRGQLGMRAAHVAHLEFDDVPVPRANVVAAPGFGLSHVAGTALDHGRYTVAWGCVGMAAACQRLATGHALSRVQDGVRLADHQLVRAMLARALVEVTAAEQLCRRAAALRASGDPEWMAATVMAKYAAARAAAAVSRDAVQIHGSAGCGADSSVGRFLRDAAVMQIIEGSEQVNEMHIADHALRGHRRATSGRATSAGSEPIASGAAS